MQIDIEKLNRKTPYPEPSEDFFKQMQTNVISQTVGQNPMAVKEKTKVFSLNFKWMAAAAILLIGGITAFFSLNNDAEVSIAQQTQTPIVDSVYEIEQPIQQASTEFIAKNNIPTDTQNEISKPKLLRKHSVLATSNTRSEINSDRNMADRQDYVIGANKKSGLEVEKVLAAFTPDQLKDIDRNSEQDVYLDLYN